jgi:ABC-type antimicrobial peptide transport system permease subunit
MKHLSSDKITELDSKPIHLSSHFSNGKLLTIDSKKNVILDDIGGKGECDQLWKLIPVGNNGFIISSSKNEDIICHYMKDQGEITVKPKNTVNKFLINKKISKDEGEDSENYENNKQRINNNNQLKKEDKQNNYNKTTTANGGSGGSSGGGGLNDKLKEELIKDDCIWSLGKDGEIYQLNPKGGERYLWLADNKLFVTLDGFLAESWVPVSNIEQFTIDVKSLKKHVLNDPPPQVETIKEKFKKTKTTSEKVYPHKLRYIIIMSIIIIITIILLIMLARIYLKQINYLRK